MFKKFFLSISIVIILGLVLFLLKQPNLVKNSTVSNSESETEVVDPGLEKKETVEEIIEEADSYEESKISPTVKTDLEGWPSGWVSWQAVYDAELVTILGPSTDLENSIIIISNESVEKFSKYGLYCDSYYDKSLCIVGSDPSLYSAFLYWKSNNQ